MGLVRIVNDSLMSVAVPDIGVHLAGRGSEVTMDADLVASSKDLGDVRAHVRLVPVVTEKKMPLWPFHRPAPPPPAPVAAPAPALPAPAQREADTLSEIRDLLKILVQQGPAAAQVAAPLSSLPIPVPASGPAAPIFIPDSILPKDAEVKIVPRESDVEKKDFEASKAALSRARRR